MSRLIALEQQVAALDALCRRLLARQAMTDDRFDKMIRHGKVTDVDTKKQLARIELASKDGTITKSDWRPYAQFAGPDGQGEGQGELKVHTPPAVGQQMTQFAPNGEWRQAVLLPFTWYDKARSPSRDADPVITRGKITVTLKKDQAVIKNDDAVFEIHSDFIRGQINESRVVVTKDVSKIRNGGHWLVATKDALVVSEPPIVGADPDEH